MAFRDPFMTREDVGTAEDDVIIGSLGNDTILGLEGDDVLGGLTGRDVLDGGTGDDVVDGGVGDDAMLGGAGDDVMIATEGDDNVNGGAGSDHYVINGTAGDLVNITDTSGDCDVLDARGAITSALIDMNAGETSYVDGRRIVLSGGSEFLSPLDLLHVQDLSGSYAGDLPVVRGLLPELIMEVEAIAPDVQYGVASFIDKPTSPFGSATDYEFLLDLALSPDSSDFTTTYDGLTTGNGNDFEESQLTALQQIALRDGAVGWRSDALRVAVLFTDADYHEAGDHASVPANNNDTTLDGTPPGTGEDYPDVATVAMDLASKGINVVLAVTSDVRPTYNALADMLRDMGVSAEVVALSDDSSDLVKAVTRGVKRLTTTEIEKAIGGDYDDEIVGNDANNMIRGRGGDDTIDGGKGGDDLYGMGDNDDISGGQGNDTISGGAGDDLLNGGGGADVINGGVGNDDIRGAGGSDLLFGDVGNDTIRGGAGSDVLNGGEGDDLLDGQGKSDTFIFDAGWGNDTVDGYSPSGTGGADDLLQIDGVNSFADFTAGAVQDGDDVVYTDGPNSITLLDTELSDISVADFIFV